MRFEKWNALGNDYAIVEAADLPFEPTPARIRALCAPHSGIGADGVLLLDAPTEAGFVASLRIFNPDGSEAELSGNGVREAVMYLRRRGWTEHDSFGIQTAAGEIRPRITGPSTCTVDMGRAKLASAADFPSGPPDGRGLLETPILTPFQFVSIGNPQCAIRWPGEDEIDPLDDLERPALEALALDRIGPDIERHELFPNRTNVSFWRPISDNAIRARIFERGVGETLSSGTGATGAAVAAVLSGLDSPVTVQLDGGELTVEIGEDLHVDLTGWAVPVYAGELGPEFLEALREA